MGGNARVGVAFGGIRRFDAFPKYSVRLQPSAPAPAFLLLTPVPATENTPQWGPSVLQCDSWATNWRGRHSESHPGFQDLLVGKTNVDEWGTSRTRDEATLSEQEFMCKSQSRQKQVRIPFPVCLLTRMCHTKVGSGDRMLGMHLSPTI